MNSCVDCCRDESFGRSGEGPEAGQGRRLRLESIELYSDIRGRSGHSVTVAKKTLIGDASARGTEAKKALLATRALAAPEAKKRLLGDARARSGLDDAIAFRLAGAF